MVNEKLCGCALAVLYVSAHRILPSFNMTLGYSEEVWNWVEKTFNPNQYTKEKRFCCITRHADFVIING